MLDLIIKLATAFSAVSMPVADLFEWKYGRGKKVKLFHLSCVICGAVIIVLDSLLCFELASNLRTPGVGDWAKDFFFGYLWTALPVVLVITGLLSLAAAIRHPMWRIRISLTVLLPVAVILATLFVASLAGDGQFAVDIYIGALAPGLGLLPHIVPLCERRKKSD